MTFTDDNVICAIWGRALTAGQVTALESAWGTLRAGLQALAWWRLFLRRGIE